MITGVMRMKTILVDDEILSLEYFAQESEGIADIEIVGKFDFPEDALDYAKENKVDLVISDINMPGMTGLELGKQLKELNPEIIIVYVTGYGEYAQEAMALRAATYIMKPYNKDDIEFAVTRAKLLYRGNKSGILVTTFGRFNVFYQGKPLNFKNSKSKELFALCIEHNGSQVSLEEAVDKLWEDKPFADPVKALYRKAVMELKNTLKTVECDDIVNTGRGSIWVDVDRIDCDYCKLLQSNYEKGDDYMGEFMLEYSWAEPTNVMIKRQIIKKQKSNT